MLLYIKSYSIIKILDVDNKLQTNNQIDWPTNWKNRAHCFPKDGVQNLDKTSAFNKQVDSQNSRALAFTF